MTYRFDGKKIIRDTLCIFEAPAPVLYIAPENEKIYFLFAESDKSQMGMVHDSNVYCIDELGNLRWKIQPVHQIKGQGFYTGLSLHEGQLRAYAAEGFSCLVDKETGKILKKVFTK